MQYIMTDPRHRASANTYPAKEWSVTDDMINISDTASVGIANDVGQAAGKFFRGDLIEIEESDPDVASGQWTRHFTGRVTGLETYTDFGGGSNLRIDAMDLGWHLTSCHATPLKNIKGIRFQKLLDILLDSSWELGRIVAGNDLNRRLKHGRQIVIQNHKPVPGSILPFIQVEPGQSPFDLLRTYAAREGLLINVSARGDLLLFRPRYDTPPLYTAYFRPSNDPMHDLNNVIGRPSLKQVIDGLYSEVQCWSTVVIPPEIANKENPNEMYRHSSVLASPNPLPFHRLFVFSDSEAINDRLRKNRALWKLQMDAFNATQYTVDFAGHSQGGAFFVSDSMISVDDTMNAVSGGMYVQRAQRNNTVSAGATTSLLCRLPGLLNPELTTLDLDLGGGARKSKAGKRKAGAVQ